MTVVRSSDPWQGGVPRSQIQGNTSPHQHTIAKLHPYFTYHIRIYAYNAIGVSQPSKEVLFTTDEEGKKNWNNPDIMMGQLRLVL